MFVLCSGLPRQVGQRAKAHFLQVCLLPEEVGVPTVMAHIAVETVVGHERQTGRGIYAKGVCCEPLGTYPTLQLHLSQLSAILFIHGARLSIHHL